MTWLKWTASLQPCPHTSGVHAFAFCGPRYYVTLRRPSLEKIFFKNSNFFKNLYSNFYVLKPAFIELKKIN